MQEPKIESAQQGKSLRLNLPHFEQTKIQPI